MKPAELSKKSEAELGRLLREHREIVRDLRFKVSAQQSKDVRHLRMTKKLIARILTELAVRRHRAAAAGTTTAPTKATVKTPA